MRSTTLDERGGHRTFAVVMDKGDEAVTELTRFAREHGITAAGLTAVGACQEATLGWFDRDRRDYRDIPVSEQVEVLSFVGDIAVQDTQPAVHVHAGLGRRDGSTVGGHVQRLVVWPTLEVVVTETPAHLRKRFDPDVGLALIAIDEH
jgi:predicted DNA-binding protein with PD1-like motif